jgi:hypothetical protein
MPAAYSGSLWHLSQLPTGRTLHSVYLRGLSPTQVSELKRQSVSAALDFGVLNADMVRHACAWG